MTRPRHPPSNHDAPRREGPHSLPHRGEPSAARTAPPAAKLHGNVPTLLWVALAAVSLGYLWLFFRQPVHQEWFIYPLIADSLLLSTFGGEQFEFTLVDRGIPVALAMALMVTGWGIGSLAIQIIGLRSAMGFCERVAFATFVGLAFVSHFTLLVGWTVGLAQEWLVIGPVACLAAYGIFSEWRETRRSGEESASASRRSVATDEADATLSTRKSDQSTWRHALWSFPFAIIVVLGSVLPPWEFDVIEYHLQTPKEWHQQGRIDFLPHNVYGNMPLGIECHALWATTLAWGEQAWWHGALAGKLVIGCLSLGTALAVFAAVARICSPRAAGIASALYLATPWVVHTSLAGLIDSALGGYLFLAAYATWRAVRSPQIDGRATDASAFSRADAVVAETARTRRRWVLLASFLGGAAAACKYPGVVYGLLPMAAWILWAESRESLPWGTRCRRWGLTCAILVLGASLGGGLWYVKNAVEAGNPVYPLAYKLWGGETRTVEKDEQWSRVHRPASPLSVSSLFTAATQVLWRSPWQNPLLFPLIVVGLTMSPLRRRLLPWLAWTAFGLAIWWGATHRIDRFWVPFIPFGALMAAAGVDPLSERWGRRVVWGGIAAGLLGLWLVDLSPGAKGEFFANNRFFVSLHTLRDASTLPAHARLNALVPADGKVLLVGDARPFYLTAPCLYATCFDDSPFDSLLRRKSPEQRRAALADAGVTHVYIDWPEIARYRSPGNYGFSDFVTPELVHRELVKEQEILVPLETIDGGEIFQVKRKR